jgi:methyl-accepting chemotaxis protein
MSAIRNLPIARKFTFAFGLICILCIGLGTYTFFTLRNVVAGAADVSGDTFPSVVHLGEARTQMTALRRADMGSLLCANPACTTHYASIRQQALTDYASAITAYQPFISAGEETDLFKKFYDTFAQYIELSNRGAGLVGEGKSSDALALLMSPSTITIVEGAMSISSDDVKLNVEEGVESAAAVTSASKRALWINVALTLVILVLSVLIGVTLTKVVAPRLMQIKEAVEAMAAKDLTASVLVTGTDEIGQLGEAFNRSVESIRAVLKSVAQGADTLSSATTEISARAKAPETPTHNRARRIKLPRRLRR